MREATAIIQEIAEVYEVDEIEVLIAIDMVVDVWGIEVYSQGGGFTAEGRLNVPHMLRNRINAGFAKTKNN